jgi:hypothetical protein
MSRNAFVLTHGEHCICTRCHARRGKLARLALVEPRRLVHADEARAHAEQLLAAGWRKKDVALAAGVSNALISKVMKDDAVVNEPSAQAILAVSEKIVV